MLASMTINSTHEVCGMSRTIAVHAIPYLVYQYHFLLGISGKMKQFACDKIVCVTCDGAIFAKTETCSVTPSEIASKSQAQRSAPRRHPLELQTAYSTTAPVSLCTKISSALDGGDKTRH